MAIVETGPVFRVFGTEAEAAFASHLAGAYGFDIDDPVVEVVVKRVVRVTRLWSPGPETEIRLRELYGNAARLAVLWSGVRVEEWCEPLIHPTDTRGWRRLCWPNRDAVRAFACWLEQLA